MRTKNSFEYTTKAEEIVLEYVNIYPQSTNAITNKLKSEVFKKIDYSTVRRLLETLRQTGKIKGFKIGKISLWNL